MRIRILLLAAATGALAAPAFAADLGTFEPVPALGTVSSATDWSGIYLGAMLGYTWGDSDVDGGGFTARKLDPSGFDGGLFAGANAQFGQAVIGVEADVLLSGVEDSVAVSEGVRARLDQNWSGSLRARAGIGLDQFLLYGTAGVAATGVEASATGLGSADETVWGWTAGLGAEALVTSNITARVEYRYADYQDQTFELGEGAEVDAGLNTHSVRAGVGVKF